MLAADCRRLIRPTRLLRSCSNVKQADLNWLSMLRQATLFSTVAASDRSSILALRGLYGLWEVSVTRHPAEVLAPALSC